MPRRHALYHRGDAAKRKATYEDLLRVPEHLVAEILDGDEALCRAEPFDAIELGAPAALGSIES